MALGKCGIASSRERPIVTRLSDSTIVGLPLQEIAELEFNFTLTHTTSFAIELISDLPRFYVHSTHVHIYIHTLVPLCTYSTYQ